MAVEPHTLLPSVGVAMAMRVCTFTTKFCSHGLSPAVRLTHSVVGREEYSTSSHLDIPTLNSMLNAVNGDGNGTSYHAPVAVVSES